MSKPEPVGDTAERKSPAEQMRAPDRPPVGDVFCPFDERLAQIEEQNPMSERTRANVRRALEMIDPAERQAFLDKYRDNLQSFETFGQAKYADFAYWAFRNVVRAEWLDLDRSPPMDILDIGMGPGSFGMVVRSMGHSVVGTDVRNPWYDDFCELAGVERVVAPVRLGERYKPIDRRFDLITIMLPVFHHKDEPDGKRSYWTVEDWRKFLAGLVRDMLKPNGRIFIALPMDKDEKNNVSASPLGEWARLRGARVSAATRGGHRGHIYFDPATEEIFADGWQPAADTNEKAQAAR